LSLAGKPAREDGILLGRVCCLGFSRLSPSAAASFVALASARIALLRAVVAFDFSSDSLLLNSDSGLLRGFTSCL
jgi:hypothetical protein